MPRGERDREGGRDMEASCGSDGRGQPSVTLLVVRPHPDDESSATGGLLAYYYARGVQTGVVICTGGEEGEIHDPALDPVADRPRFAPVVFQKWRWTVIAVTLGLIFVVSLRKEWPMTFIAVRCPHCQSDQIVKRGKTARGTQRYLCQNTLCPKGSFLLDYCNRGCLPEVKHMIIDMSLNASGVRDTARSFEFIPIKSWAA